MQFPVENPLLIFAYNQFFRNAKSCVHKAAGYEFLD